VGVDLRHFPTKRLEAGSFAIIPAGVPHFVVAEDHTIFQLHSLGPMGNDVCRTAQDGEQAGDEIKQQATLM
jgi:quercetin dioxygenase-like cupin family protein